MAAHQNDKRLEKIVEALGIDRDSLLAPGAGDKDLSDQETIIDGAPDQFERWSDGIADPKRRKRLTAIAGVLRDSQKKRGKP